MKFDHHFDATATAQAIKTGDITPLEAVKHAIETVEKENETYNAVLHLYKEEAIKQAEALKDFSAPFAGVPILLKDAGQDYAGHPSTVGSELLKDNLATHTSHFVQAIIDAGFIIIGHTNVPEFALKFISDSAYFGPVHNPVNPKYHAGGSSGGAASALQRGMVPIATASDGGGSIRIPASFSGLIGLKPTRSRTPAGPGSYRSWGGAAIDFALTTSIRDTEAMLMLLQTNAYDAMPFSPPLLTTSAMEKAKASIKSLRFAYTTQNFIDHSVDKEAIKAVNKTVTFLKTQGFSVEEAHPSVDGLALLKGYFAMNAAEQAKSFNTLEKGLGRSIKRGDTEDSAQLLAEYGKRIPAWRYSEIFDEWDRLAQQMQDFHNTYDILIQPATAKPAPAINQMTLRHDLMEKIDDFSALSTEALEDLILEVMLPGTYHSPYAYPYNLTGQPALSLPLHTTAEGLPLGVMFTARKNREDLLIAIGDYLEAQEKFHYYH